MVSLIERMEKSFCLFYHKYCTYILRYILNITTKLKKYEGIFFFAVLPWPTVCCCQWCRNHTLHLRHSIQGVKLSCRWIICCWSGVWLSQRQKYCFPSLRWQHHLTDDYAVQTAQKQMNIHKTNANDSVWPWMAS